MENVGFVEASTAGRLSFRANDTSWMVFEQNATRGVILVIITVALSSLMFNPDC